MSKENERQYSGVHQFIQRMDDQMREEKDYRGYWGHNLELAAKGVNEFITADDTVRLALLKKFTAEHTKELTGGKAKFSPFLHIEIGFSFLSAVYLYKVYKAVGVNNFEDFVQAVADLSNEIEVGVKRSKGEHGGLPFEEKIEVNAALISNLKDLAFEMMLHGASPDEVFAVAV